MSQTKQLHNPPYLYHYLENLKIINCHGLLSKVKSKVCQQGRIPHVDLVFAIDLKYMRTRVQYNHIWNITQMFADCLFRQPMVTPPVPALYERCVLCLFSGGINKRMLSREKMRYGAICPQCRSPQATLLPPQNASAASVGISNSQ